MTRSNPAGDLRLNFAGGLDVFEGGFANARSPGLFAASLGHELEVHGRQLREGRMAYGAVDARDDDVGTAVNEIEAYGYMMRQSNRYGLDDEERVMVGGRMDDFTRGLLRHGQIDPADLANAAPEIRQSFEAALPSRRGPGPGREDPRATQAIRQILRGDFSLPEGVTPVVPGAGNDSEF